MLKRLGIFFSAPKRAWKKFKALSLKKKILVVIALVIFSIVTINVISNLTKKPNYTTAKVERSDITEAVTETGDVTVSGTVNVYSPTNGTVQDVFIKNEDKVKEGDELLTINSSATEQEVQAAYANYMTAVSTLGTAQAIMYSLQSSMFDVWDTYKNLAENSTYENGDGTPKTDQRTAPEFHIAEKDWLAAEAKYKNQQSVVYQAQALVSSTWLLYQATQNSTVKAPSAGTVSNLSVASGSNVSINTAIQPAVAVLTISNSKATEATVSLSETDITKVKEGQKADVEVTSQDKTYKGVVKRVDSIGSLDQGVIRYNAYIELSNPDNALRSGMTSDVTIITQELENVLSVPNSAVKPYQGGRAVRIMGRNKKIEYIPVKIGIKGGSKTQILYGVEEGQEIITTLSNEQLKRPGLFN